MKNNKGITLLALIITIIILLLLAGLAIAMISVNEETGTASENSEVLISSAKEEVVSAINEGYAQYYKTLLGGNNDNIENMLFYIESELEELEADFDIDNITMEYENNTVTLTYSSSTINTSIIGEITEDSETGVVEFDWKGINE